MKFWSWLHFILPLAAAAAIGRGGSCLLVTDERMYLPAGMHLTSLTIVLSGGLTLEHGATLDGDLIIAGGSTRLDGLVLGTLTVVGGHVDIGEQAVIHGRVSVVSGHVQPSEPRAEQLTSGLLLAGVTPHTGRPALDGLLWLFVQLSPVAVSVYVLARGGSRPARRLQSAVSGLWHYTLHRRPTAQPATASLSS